MADKAQIRDIFQIPNPRPANKTASTEVPKSMPFSGTPKPFSAAKTPATAAQKNAAIAPDLPARLAESMSQIVGQYLSRQSTLLFG